MRQPLCIAAVLLCAGASGLAGTRQTVWEVRTWTYVKLVPREKGAKPNQHPARMDKEALRTRLALLEVPDDAETLFEKKELLDLVKPLSEAFAEARPDEDVALVSTDRRGHGLLAPALAATARLFVEDGQVNAIFHDTRFDFYGRIYANDMAPTFEVGSRATPSKVVLKAAPGLVLKRADWVTFPVADPAPVEAVPAAAAPAAAPEPAPAPSVKAAPAPAPAPQAKPAAPSVEDRLRALKKLRDADLITEEEYRKKKEEILAAL